MTAMKEQTGKENGDRLASAGTEAVSRAADVLLMYIEGPDLIGISTIARELGLSKAVVHRILQSLAAKGIVVPDGTTRAYRLGPAAAALGARSLKSLDLLRDARDALVDLRDRTGETTTLSALVGRSRVYLDQVASYKEVKMVIELGDRHPLHVGGTGKAILAFAPESLIEEVLARPLEAMTAASVTDREALLRELAVIRTEGVATSLGERRADAASIAAPIFDFAGGVIGAISVCGPIGRFTPEVVEQTKPLVRAASAEVSRKVGSFSRSKPVSPS